MKFIRETHSWNNKKAFRNLFNTLVFSNAFIYNFAKGKTEGFSLRYFSIFFAGRCWLLLQPLFLKKVSSIDFEKELFPVKPPNTNWSLVRCRLPIVISTPSGVRLGLNLEGEIINIRFGLGDCILWQSSNQEVRLWRNFQIHHVHICNVWFAIIQILNNFHHFYLQSIIGWLQMVLILFWIIFHAQKLLICTFAHLFHPQIMIVHFRTFELRVFPITQIPR